MPGMLLLLVTLTFDVKISDLQDSSWNITISSLMTPAASFFRYHAEKPTSGGDNHTFSTAVDIGTDKFIHTAKILDDLKNSVCVINFNSKPTSFYPYTTFPHN